MVEIFSGTNTKSTISTHVYILEPTEQEITEEGEIYRGTHLPRARESRPIASKIWLCLFGPQAFQNDALASLAITKLGTCRWEARHVD
jgi:hypothetical protein